MLEDEGFGVLLKNAFLGGGAGELPPTDVWPELWVLDDADYDRAMARVQELLAEQTEPAPDWTCPRCGEVIEGQFAQCWNCGAAREVFGTP